MSTSWDKDLTQSIIHALRELTLFRHVRRIWKFEDKSLVFDFSYKNIQFGFDLTPVPEGGLLLARVQRGRLDRPFSVVQGAERKAVLAEAASAAEVPALLSQDLLQVLARIDAYVSGLEGASSAHEAPRVGVLTLPLGKNYGGNLQAFALMQKLRDLGCDPVLLNRRYAVEAPKEDAAFPLIPIVNKIKIVGPNRTTAFIEKHILPISRPFYSSAQLSRSIKDFDLSAVVTGSDQVWQPKYARGVLGDLFHGYLPADNRDIRRISYAASFGADEWSFDDQQTRAARERIALFDAVSVREDSGADMCRDHLGVSAQHVLDPVLLLDRSRYGKIIGPLTAKRRQARLTTYILDQSQDKMDLVAQIAERLGLIPAPTSRLRIKDKPPAADHSVETWLAAFWNADFVFTDSFHGVAFSILFNKPFIAFSNPKRGIARFTSILRVFGLEDRLIRDAASADIDAMLKPIDWEQVNARLDAARAKSVQFLREGLGLAPQTAAKNTVLPPVPRPVAPVLAKDIAGASTAKLGQLCTGCGICATESAGGLAMEWDQDGFWAPRPTGLSMPQNVMRVCPFNTAPEATVADEDAIGKLVHRDAPNYHVRGGRFENTYIGYSKAHRPSSSSGGIATYVFDQLLKRGNVQKLFVVGGDASGGYHYRAVAAGEPIETISKTRYFPVTLEKLIDVINGVDGKVAISGVACFIKAVRLKQHYDQEFSDKIGFLSGIVCGGLKSRFYTDYLAQSAGIESAYKNAEYRVKNPEGEANDYFFSAEDEAGKTHDVRMRRLGDMWGSGLFKNKACDFCTDVLTELADISLGDAWIPEYNKDGMGNSVVITRSALADKIIREGIASGALALTEVSMDLVLRSQSGGVNHKLNGLKFRHWFSEHFTSLPIPALRTRHEKELTVAEMLVQVMRERVRSKSLKAWQETGDLARFNARMRTSRSLLGAVTGARKKQPDAIYAMFCAGLGLGQPKLRGANVAAVRPLLIWVKRKLRSGALDLSDLLPLLPKDQAFDLGAPNEVAEAAPQLDRSKKQPVHSYQ